MTANDTPAGRLSDWQIIRLAGADRHDFLQGQLTQDTAAVTETRPLPAGWANPKGRLLFTGWLLDFDEALHLLLPGALAPAIARRLAMFKLRAAVDISEPTCRIEFRTDNSDEYLNTGYWNKKENIYQFGPGPGALISLAATGEPETASADTADIAWRHWCIENGWPVVFTGTQESFVPQMVNLDCIGGISFTKGCYVGQEIVARTHNLGRIKRRMFRLTCDTTAAAQNVAPGADIYSGETLAGTVVDAVETESAVELLAVLKLDGDRSSLSLGKPDGPSLTTASLPYPVPEVD